MICDPSWVAMAPITSSAQILIAWCQWKKAAFTQFLREGIWIAPDGVDYMGHSVRTDRYRYTEWVNWETKELAATELYDHEGDPKETRNVAGEAEYADARREMAAILEAGWRAALPE